MADKYKRKISEEQNIEKKRVTIRQALGPAYISELVQLGNGCVCFGAFKYQHRLAKIANFLWGG